jgi:DNA polymerase I-like protein with 3'-5' exonuclease and polymerase domains/uracil-DNA glycosylase
VKKPDFCTDCSISRYTGDKYIPLQCGSGTELFVSDAGSEDDGKVGRSLSDGTGSWFNSMLRAARIAKSTINLINTIGCCPPDRIFPGSDKWTLTDRGIARQAVDRCAAHHLQPALSAINPTRVVALGPEALYQLTGRSGIELWRGSPLPLKEHMAEGPRVVATLHPSALMKQAKLFSVATGDLRRGLTLPPENYDLYPTIDTVRAFNATSFAFDFEWDTWGNITMCGLSNRYYSAIVVPFVGDYIPELQRIFEGAEEIIGHNIVDADTWYFEKFGWKVRARLMDTMLAQHLIQPDMKHGLSFVASVFTGKVFWKGHGEEHEDESGNILPTGAQWRTWDSPEAIPRNFGGYGGCNSADEAWRLYNARDTDGSLQAATPIFRLLREWQQEPVYRNVSVPAAYICRDMNRAGLKLNHSRITRVREGLITDIARIESTLPEGLLPYDTPITKTISTPEGTYKPRSVTCKGNKQRGIHEPVVYDCAPTDTLRTCEVCGRELKPKKLVAIKRIKVPSTKRIVPWNSTPMVLKYAQDRGLKPVQHLKTGADTADKRARKIWGRTETEFTIVDQLKKLNTLKNSFAKPGLLQTERIFFRLAVTGTSEGRLSAAGQRRGIDPNIQNQPKDIRKIYIPDSPAHCFVKSDVIQGENMLTAHLAKDYERLERLNTAGYNEHCHMGKLFFNTDVDKKNPLYRGAKIINHGRNYGLGQKTTQEYLAAEGFYYAISDIREMFEIWKKINARTAQWQRETVEIAQKQGYLQNPFGRRRWFQGRDFATKALAFLPASTLADVVFRMMIALCPEREEFSEIWPELNLSVVASMPEGYRLAIQVHDEICLHGPKATWQEAAHALQAVMTQPWKELDGFSLRCDMEYCPDSWGEGIAVQDVLQLAA